MPSKNIKENGNFILHKAHQLFSIRKKQDKAIIQLL
jgi:hypothetical protein